MFKLLVAVAGLGAAFGEILTFEDAATAIRAEVNNYRPAAGKALCNQYECCNVTESQSCGISSMPRDETTLVLPGGETRCIFSYSTPFAFQVIPGDSDKLLFYFQGGGACWDEMSTKLGFCTSDSSPQSPVGIFDRTNSKNAFKDYTIVHVLYCSGDIFGGNVVRPYDDKDGQPVVQKGLANAQSALDWIVAQQTSGQLAATFSSVVVMGCSAGSIGAQLWSDSAIHSLKWETMAIVPDSYAGVFPEGSQGPLVYDFGFCTSGFLNEENYAKCMDETLTLQDINAQYMATNSHIPYAFIQSKTDIVQMSFYVAVGLSMNMTAAITPELFYDDVNTIFEGYNTNSNFLTYLVDGDQHCFTPMNLYYTADAISAEDNGASSSMEMMSVWSGHFPLAEGESETTVCEGEIQSSATKAVNNQVYCDADIVSKEFVEEY